MLQGLQGKVLLQEEVSLHPHQGVEEVHKVEHAMTSD